MLETRNLRPPHGKMQLLSIPLILMSTTLLNNYCQAQYSQNIPPDNVINEAPKGPPQPIPFALSSTYLIHLARTEAELYEEMLKYSEQLSERMELVKAYLKDYEDTTVKAVATMPRFGYQWEKAKQIASHPITAYRMVRRFATEYDAVEKHMAEQHEGKLEDNTIKLRGVFPWPSKKDVNDAMEAILQIHYVYDLNVEEFANGTIMGSQSQVGLLPTQTLQIAQHALDLDRYTLAMDWLKVTESKVKEDGGNTTIKGGMASVGNAISVVLMKHDRFFKKNQENSHLYMYTERLSKNSKPATVRSVNYANLKGLTKEEHPQADHYRFLALCNGENFQTPKYKATLKCWYDKKNPYFYLFPLKAELYNHDPLLIQYHDVISEKWIQEAYKAAIPTLERGKTGRTAIYAWLEDEHIPHVPIARKIELVTGHNVRGINASEILQVASYTYGGHASLHYDSLGAGSDHPTIKLKGDRLMTYLNYLNDVEQGGFTAFPILGTSIKPKKGSAIFWYNARKNGRMDLRMFHGACPVVLGHKWIATKWTHLNKNFLTRPCDLNQEE